jgi:hypothetical protein
MRHPKRRRSTLVHFSSWWSSWPPTFAVQKDGRQTCVASIPLQQTNFKPSDETMTKVVLENMWQQWHAAPGNMETKERGRYTWQGTNHKGMGWLQEGINWYNELFKETVLNQKEIWAIDFEMLDVVESLKE